jgi:nucleoside-diphosphate-sugar epimerase
MENHQSLKLVITGANGFIGEALARHFANQGHQVTALVRHLYKVPPANIQYRTFDLASFGSDVIPNDTDVVIHAAYSQAYDHNRDINLKATQRLAEISHRKKVKQFVFISSLSGHSEAISNYGKSKWATKNLLNLNLDLILEPGLVIGNDGLFISMWRLVKQNTIIPIFNQGRQSIQYIHIDDFVNITEQCVTNQITGYYPMAHPQSMDMKSFIKTIAQMQGKKVVLVSIPFTVADLLFKLVDLFGINLGVNQENLKGLKQMRMQSIRFPEGFDIQKLKNLNQIHIEE